MRALATERAAGSRILRLGTLLLLLAAVAAAANAQEETTGVSLATREITATDIRERKKLAEESTELDDNDRALVLERYRKALEQAEVTDEWLREADRLEHSRGAAPERLSDLHAQLSEAEISDDRVPVGDVATLSGELEQMDSEYTKRSQELAQLDRRIQQRPARRKALTALLETARRRLGEEERHLGPLASDTGSFRDEQLALAGRTLRLVTIDALRAEILAYKEEIVGFLQTGRVLSAEEDLTAARMRGLEELVDRWGDARAEARRAEAQLAANETYQALVDVSPMLQSLARENRELALLRVGPDGLASRIETARAELREVDNLATSIEGSFARTRLRVDGVGHSKYIGFLLRQKRPDLPDPRTHTRRIRELQEKIQAVQIARVEAADQRFDLVDRTAHEIERAQDTLELSSEQPEAEAIRTIFSARIPLLDDLIRDYDRYFTLLLDIDASERRVVASTTEFDTYIAEHILWTPSADIVSRADFRIAGKALAALAEGSEWAIAWRSLRNQFRDDGARSWPLLFLVALLGLGHRRWRRGIEAAAAVPRLQMLLSVRPVLLSLLYTLLATLFWPALAGAAGWLLTVNGGNSLYAQAFGSGLIAASGFLVPTLLWANVCRAKGLAEAHFGWSAASLAVLRKSLRLILRVILPAGFLASVYYASTEPEWAESIGRFCLLIAMPVMSYIFYDVLRPGGPTLSGVLARRKTGWFSRLRYVWYPGAVGTPLALAGVAIFGYTYTAFELTDLLVITIGVLLFTVLAYQMAYRVLWVLRASIATKEARKAREHTLTAGDAERPSPEVPEAATEPEIDVVQVNEQTLSIVRGVLFVAFAFFSFSLWVQVLPALEYLKGVELWSVGSATGPRPVTLFSLLMVATLLSLAVVAVRNLPGLLDIVWLTRTSTADRGLRFAIATLSRYLILGATVVAAAGAIGINWDRVQWLVAAMSVGLGFGLQEIFANFVSGVVLLIERPMRVGDIVTVAGINGRVTKIQLRATTVLDFDRRELVVPNREFVTGQLINWTLTEPVVRYKIVVGVAYGSDTRKVTESLLRVADENEVVLKEPAPQVIFHEFGDSALNFWLYFYLPHRDFHLNATHQLHTAIDETFREAGITIAFPQRDVHVDSAGPVDVRIVSENPAR